MVHAMDVHAPESVKPFFEEQHVGDLPLPFVASCNTYNTVVSDTYGDAYNCLTYTDEDILATEQQRSGLLVQQPRVDLVSPGSEDLANSLINSHRDYRLAVLSTVPTTVQNLDSQCNIVETLNNFSTRNNATPASVVVSNPTETWQIHSADNAGGFTTGHTNIGTVTGVNIGTSLGQKGTILAVAANSPGTASSNVSSSGHHHHHHHSHHQHSGGSSNHSRSSSSGGSSSGGSSKPKRRRVQTTAQRKAANVRERRRMFHLNEAFDELRKRLPAFNYEKRLSRIETLRLAMTYIGFMKEVTTGKDPCDIELQKYKKLDGINDCDMDDEDEEEDEENSQGDNSSPNLLLRQSQV